MIYATIEGNTTKRGFDIKGDGSSRFAVATLVSTQRVKKGDEWSDSDPTFVEVIVNDKAAIDSIESNNLTERSVPIVASGRLKTRKFEYVDKEDGETYEGENLVLTADTISLGIKFQSINISRADKPTSAKRAGAKKPAKAKAAPVVDLGDDFNEEDFEL